MRFLLVLLIATLSCCQAVGIPPQNQDNLQKLIEGEIGTKAIIKKNGTETFALAFQTQNRSVAFIVVRLTDMKVVVKEKIREGAVTWSGDLQIKVNETPGIVKTDSRPEDHTRLINLNNYVINRK
ncbi:MAG TPA: hypothetical protein VKQ08_09490 [Cyclobacteriaceae bacterium]|nr:hypothetical protein [Cyclobacteriaceae bacterium]